MKAKHYIWSLLILTLIAGCAANDGEFFAEEENNSKTIYMALTLNSPSLKTRQSDQVTQATEQTDGSHFRGIQDLLILPYSVQPTGSDCIDKTDQAIGEKVGVDETLTDLYHNQPYADKGAPNDKYYLQVPLKIGTNAFLVYGRATEKTGTTDLETKQINGTLTKAGTDGKPASSFTFSPVPMVETIAEGKAASAKGDAIITYLNSIFNANWADKTNYPALYGVYEMASQLQAGSSASVLAFIQKVYELLLPARATDYVDAALDAIEAGATVSGNVITALPTACQGFPGDLGLPDGAAVILWNTTSNAFEAVTSKTNFNGLNVDVTKFCFPAELYYRANSRIHTGTQPLMTAVDPNTQAQNIFNKAKWAGTDDSSVLGQLTTSGSALFTPNGIVTAKTTIVAITDPLQYAVGRVDVKLTASATLKDANDEEFTPATDFAITGVLIGQQSPVDYKFNSTYAAETDPLYTIYDNQVEAAAATIGTSTPVHTLALETVKDQKVNIAIELQNNSGKSIMTVNGDVAQIIPASCKFYLVGQINPANPFTGSETADGKAIAQDHYTTVTFNLNDITKAYYVVPDLNTADLEFTLKVIDWKLSTPSEAVLN
ncbi:MAG: hypothetical protein IJ209_09645 [Bacteroidaceae bacterium]|nr:hypothetical protein [Bacteroidaceae bacterium]